MKKFLIILLSIFLLTGCSKRPQTEEVVKIIATYDYIKYSTEELQSCLQDKALQEILLFYMPGKDLDGKFVQFQEFPEMCENLSISKFEEGYKVSSKNISYYIVIQTDLSTGKVKSFTRRFI